MRPMIFEVALQEKDDPHSDFALFRCYLPSPFVSVFPEVIVNEPHLLPYRVDSGIA